MPDTTKMVNYRTCLASELEDKSIIPGSFILCSDTGDFYTDTLSGERIRIAQQVIFLSTEAERSSILAPVEFSLYIVIASKRGYIFSNSTWNCIFGQKTVYEYNTSVPANGSVEISNDFIIDTATAEFIPYPEFLDLCTDTSFSCTCDATTKKVTVASTVDYDIMGILSINV